MRKMLVTALGIVVVTLTVSGLAQAQNWIQVPGRLQAVDCQTNALVLNAADGTHIFPMAPNAAVFLNSTAVSFCTLRQFVGAYATASVQAVGSQLVAARVDVFTAAAVPPPPPGVYYPCCFPPFGISFGIGIVFGPGFHHWR